MSYVVEQAESLLRVLERAVPLPAHRVAGYAANAEFWASEVTHCRELLDGYMERARRRKQGTDDYLHEHPLTECPLYADTRSTRNTTDSEIRELRRRLDEAARRFFGRLSKVGLLSDERLDELDGILGHEIIEK